MQTKIRNLKTGQLLSRNFKPADTFAEADIEKKPIKFIYGRRGEYVFSETNDPSKRFTLKEEVVKDNKKWLKPNTEVSAIFFEDKIINLSLPIKMDLKVTEAPPGVQGDRAQSGTKAITLETGAVIQAPLFINTGDTIRINTESGLYVERAEKA